jgi:hypothetical protein
MNDAEYGNNDKRKMDASIHNLNAFGSIQNDKKKH